MIVDYVLDKFQTTCIMLHNQEIFSEKVFIPVSLDKANAEAPSEKKVYKKKKKTRANYCY